MGELSQFTSLLLSISKEIEKSELKTMKFCCSDYKIGAKRLGEISEAYELFKELMKRELLGPENKEILVMLLEKTDRIDLKNIVLGIQGSTRVESQTSVPDGPVVHDELKDTRLNDIAEELGGEWKPLGRKLGISASILGNIDQENHRVKEKAFQMLSRWKKRSGNNATGQALADALIATGRRDVAEILERNCRQDGVNIHTSEDQRTQNSDSGLNTMQADLAPGLPTQESRS